MTKPASTRRAFAPFEWIIALRYLRSRRKESVVSLISALSFLGIMLGVAALIVVMAVMNGFRHELLERILGVNGHLIVRAIDGGTLPDARTISDRLEQVPGVIRGVPVIEGQVLATSARGSIGVFVRGQKAEDIQAMPVITAQLEEDALNAYRNGEALVGRGLARKLSLSKGGTISLLSPNGPATPFGTAPRQRSYEIAGIFAAGMSEIDSNFIFLPLAQARDFFSLGKPESGHATAIEVIIENAETAPLFTPLLAEAAEAPVRVRPWQRTHATLAAALEVERNVMFIILSLIVLVAALNIISGMVMLVKDKRGEIAILRAMGAGRPAIMRIFLITGFSIGLAGTLTGLGLGLLLCAYIEEVRQLISGFLGADLFPAEVYFLEQLPADVDVYETATATLMALALSLGATLYPAWRAASLEPVDVLRHE